MEALPTRLASESQRFDLVGTLEGFAPGAQRFEIRDLNGDLVVGKILKQALSTAAEAVGSASAIAEIGSVRDGVDSLPHGWWVSEPTLQPTDRSDLSRRWRRDVSRSVRGSTLIRRTQTRRVR